MPAAVAGGAQVTSEAVKQTFAEFRAEVQTQNQLMLSSIRSNRNLMLSMMKGAQPAVVEEL
eukprot:1666399-Prymnesium_polylepis.1